MAVIKVKPTSPGRRAVVKVVHKHLHKGAPEASLLEPQKQLTLATPFAPKTQSTKRKDEKRGAPAALLPGPFYAAEDDGPEAKNHLLFNYDFDRMRSYLNYFPQNNVDVVIQEIKRNYESLRKKVLKLKSVRGWNMLRSYKLKKPPSKEDTPNLLRLPSRFKEPPIEHDDSEMYLKSPPKRRERLSSFQSKKNQGTSF